MTGPTWRDTLDDADDWRVLTVKPPWSWAIAHGGKTIENRTQAWHYRGPLLIHAGAGWSTRGAQSQLVRAAWHGGDVLDLPGVGYPAIPAPERHGRLLVPGGPFVPHHRGYEATRVIWHGTVIAVANLIDVHVAGPCAEPGGPCHPWGETSYTEASGRHRADVVHLVLDDVLGFTDGPPASGRLGLWDPNRWAPDALAATLAIIDEVLNPPPGATP